DAGEVADATATDEHDRVLLQVVALAGDVGRDLDAARQADTGDLAERRVRLLGCCRVHTGAHAATLGRSLERRRLALGELRAAPLADELLNGGHGVPRVSTPARAGPCFPGPVQPACGGLVVTDRRTPRSNRDERPWQCSGRGD